MPESSSRPDLSRDRMAAPSCSDTSQRGRLDVQSRGPRSFEARRLPAWSPAPHPSRQPCLGLVGCASGAAATCRRTRSISRVHTSLSTATPAGPVSVSQIASGCASLHTTNRTALRPAPNAISFLQKSGPRRADCAERSHTPRGVSSADPFASFPRPSGRGRLRFPGYV